MARLSLSTLAAVPAALRPAVDVAGLRVGIVHLGIGAFHRAHQAVYTEEAMAAAGSADWGICGVTQRSADVVSALRPQDGLYSVLERGVGDPSLRVVGSVREVLFALSEYDGLIARLAAPATRVVTVTVTEKGYRHDPSTGALRLDDAEIFADLAGRPARTVVGQLVRGLAARRAADAGPIAVVCCDNLPANGVVLRGLVTEFASRLESRRGPAGPMAAGPAAGGPAALPGLVEWIAANVAFPSTMVDRIVPAATAADRREAARLLGVEDHGVVTAEPFRQWVIEDVFPAGRPAWERAGAILTDDVTPYERAKLRLLNGSHSTIAYLGQLAGATFVAEVVASDELREVVGRLMAEVAPTLAVPSGFDLTAYQESLLARFANPSLAHRIEQIAMDGSQKLPQRLLQPARELLAAGSPPYWVALAVAAWMRCVAGRATDDGAPLPLDDPLAGRLRSVVAHADSPGAVVDALLSVSEVFGADLRDDPQFCGLVREHYERLATDGVAGAVKAALADGP